MCGAQIHEAAKALDLNKVARLIDSEPSLVNAKDSFGRTPLHWAVLYDSTPSSSGDALPSKRQYELVELLLAKGAEINAKSSDGSTPLHFVAGRNNEIVKLLINHGAEADIFNAAMLDMAERVKELLHANPGLVVAKDHSGMTALHWAAARCQLNALKILLAGGAEPNSSSESGETPLQAAAYIGCHDVVQLLLDHGARVDPRERQSGLTALHRAAEGGDQETIKLLLAKGADVNVKESRNGNECTPLHLAAKMGRKDAVKELLAAGANINAKDSDGRAPLWHALHSSYGAVAESEGRKKIAEILREHGGQE